MEGRKIIFPALLIWQNNCQYLCMHLSSLFPSLILFFQLLLPVDYKELIGSWQLVHFDGIEKIVYSPDYQNASPEQRAGMEARIKFRLENTVYEFMEENTLKYIDFENQTVIRKEAKVELLEGNMLLIHDEKGDRLARIVEISTDKLVIQPISKNSSTGKLVFERIKKKDPMED